MTRPTHLIIFVIIAIAIAAMWFASAAQAQMCGSRDAFVEKLTKEYSETQRGVGLVGSAAIVEIWVSSATGSWSIIQTTPDGQTCLVASGDRWQDFADAVNAMAGDPA